MMSDWNIDNSIPLSLIVPVYRVEDYIVRCVSSLLDQSFHNYEIIVVDDGSPDRSIEVLEDYIHSRQDVNAEGLPKIRILHQDNQGLSGARNTGIRAARGDYLWFIDSDDAIAPDCLTTLIGCLDEQERAGNPLDMLVFDTEEILEVKSEDGTRQIPFLRPDRLDGKVKSGRQLFIEMREKKCYLANANGYLIRRELFQQNHLTFYPGILHEDELFTPVAMYYADPVQYVRFSPYLYYRRENSITTAGGTAADLRRLHGTAEAARQLAAFLQRTENEDRIDDGIHRASGIPDSNAYQAYREAFCDNIKGLLANYYGTLSQMRHVPDDTIRESKEMHAIQKRLGIRMGAALHLYTMKNKLFA